MIKEIWGNGSDIVIKFIRDKITYWADSRWNRITYQYTNNYLKNKGFRRIK